jgi:thiol-disulfide isomerase/thioredoxin
VNRFLVLFALLASFAAAAGQNPAAVLEREVTAAVQGPQVTLVHFWAPWCPNCKAELQDGDWSKFVNSHPQVKVIFITTWNNEQGVDMLAKYGLAKQANFASYLHPNPSLRREDKVSSFMGLPLSWIPSTWIFKDGKLRYALNYGELRFAMLEQLVDDSSNAWNH